MSGRWLRRIAERLGRAGLEHLDFTGGHGGLSLFTLGGAATVRVGQDIPQMKQRGDSGRDRSDQSGRLDPGGVADDQRADAARHDEGEKEDGRVTTQLPSNRVIRRRSPQVGHGRAPAVNSRRRVGCLAQRQRRVEALRGIGASDLIRAATR